MKNTSVIIYLFFLGFMSHAQISIEGHWQPEGKDAVFKIYEEDGKYYGQLIGSNNPEEDKKIKEKEPIILLRNLEKKTDTKYCCGTFISPENKKEVTASFALLDDNTLKFNAKKGPFSKSVTWKRIKTFD